MAHPNTRDVFLNVPYDERYEDIFLGLLAALIAIGRVPKLALEVQDGKDQAERIFALLSACRISFHDLSQQEHGPRHNMPFELGMAWTIDKFKPRSHDFYIIDKEGTNLPKTLSDLSGYPVEAHNGTGEGSIRTVLEHLANSKGEVAFEDVKPLYQRLKQAVAPLKARHNAPTLFGKRIFKELIIAATEMAKELELLK